MGGRGRRHAAARWPRIPPVVAAASVAPAAAGMRSFTGNGPGKATFTGR